MAHALIWSELSTSDLTSEITPELPFAGFGTITSGSWNKRLFKLKWLNSSVENINIWVENEYADVYTNSSYPVVKKTDNIKLLQEKYADSFSKNQSIKKESKASSKPIACVLLTSFVVTFGSITPSSTKRPTEPGYMAA